MKLDEVGEDERDAAWLAARARGEAAEHPDPARAAAYVRLERALAVLEAPASGEGWQAKVLAAIDRDAEAGGGPKGRPAEGAARGPAGGPEAEARGEGAAVRELPARRGEARQRWRSILPLVAAALAVAALWLFIQGGAESRGEAVSYYFEGGGARGEHRDDQAAVGQTLVLRARPEGKGELRLYRDRRELVLRCPGGEGCEWASERGRALWRVKAPLTAPGRYRAIVLSGATLSAPSGNEDQDLAAAVKAGAKVDSASFTVL
ncbi:MAG TPA: hypothetical protein VFS43_42700 [Polyangiaceae bacterium]|nr:hypothetical protein [Polyangiaceae bacterium]